MEAAGCQPGHRFPNTAGPDRPYAQGQLRRVLQARRDVDQALPLPDSSVPVEQSASPGAANTDIAADSVSCPFSTCFDHRASYSLRGEALLAANR